MYINMFNKQQNDIIDYDYINNTNSLCVIAGAGSGKTTTIINKIAKLIKSGCFYDEFFITTFTRNAASQLKDKLIDILDNDVEIDNMNIGTFHSLAYKYLCKYKKIGESIASNYDKLLIDYLNLIKKEEYKNKEVHNYIFIDEFQDIDDIQHEIIMNMFNTNYNNTRKLLIVIGDDQQNIYSFRGSNIKYILNFPGNILKLETNYRCIPAIVDISNKILSYNKNKIDKIFISSKKINTKINLKILDNYYNITEYIIYELYLDIIIN